MIVECAHCGAPLDVTSGATVITCRYCGVKNERARVRTIAEVTPKDFKPPQKWRPPAEFAADSSKELEYKRSGPGLVGCAIILVAFGLPVVIGTCSYLTDRGTFGPDAVAIGKVTTLGTRQAVGKELGGNSSSTSLYIKLPHATYKALSITWEEKDPAHATSFVFLPRAEKTTCDPGVRARLASALHGGLDPSGSWRFVKISVDCNADGGYVSASVDRDDNPVWQEQLDAAWRVVTSALYDPKLAPDAKTMRDLLGAPHPSADLTKVPFDTKGRRREQGREGRLSSRRDRAAVRRRRDRRHRSPALSPRGAPTRAARGSSASTSSRSATLRPSARRSPRAWRRRSARPPSTTTTTWPRRSAGAGTCAAPT